MRVHALAVGVLLALPAAAEFEPWEWASLGGEGDRLQTTPGERDRKLTWITKIRQEDSARVAQLLFQFAHSSASRRDHLAPRVAKAAEEFRSIDRMLREKHGKGVKREILEKNATWKKRRDALRKLSSDLDTEAAVLEALREAFATMRSAEAAVALVRLSDVKLEAWRRASEVRAGVLAALCAQPGDAFEGAILAFATDADLPHVRVRVLDRIAARKMPGGFDVAVPCLGAKEPLVVRAAVAALKALDDPRAVPPLVNARQGAKGLAAEEIDLLLHRFTGKRFSGAGADTMWAGWWKSEGEAWLASAGPERFEGGVGGSGGTDFYGIETRSDRIVFVLDRSYSMRLPVPQKGPVSGAKRDEGVAGGTKLEVAKNELERTIRKLPPEVHIGVVFFGANVKSWQQPPGLLAATPENRKRAIDWFAALDPEGSTPIFAALADALRYAKIGGGKSATDPAGADTIFLLSDGAPTRPGTDELLLGPELETAIQDFLEANRGFKCVVHTIGVGPEHNRELMMRLARETGGTYRAVGAE